MDSTCESFLTVVFEGQPVQAGRMPISLLTEFLSGFRKVLYRTAKKLYAKTDGSPQGTKPQTLGDLLDLDLVEITHGSPSTLLRFAKSPKTIFPESEFFPIESALQKLEQTQTAGSAMLADDDKGLLLAWRDVGRLFRKGIDSITFHLHPLHHRPEVLKVHYTPAGFHVLEQLLHPPSVQITQIEGRLLMADFQEGGLRLRLHPPFGKPVICLFDEEQKKEVLENLLRHVRVIGEALTNPVTGQITRIRIRDIEPLDDFHDVLESISSSALELDDFWKTRTLEELAHQQGVSPVDDIRKLYGTWPGEPEDDFENFIQQLRQNQTIGENPP